MEFKIPRHLGNFCNTRTFWEFPKCLGFWETSQISSHLRNFQNLKNIPPSNICRHWEFAQMEGYHLVATWKIPLGSCHLRKSLWESAQRHSNDLPLPILCNLPFLLQQTLGRSNHTMNFEIHRIHFISVFQHNLPRIQNNQNNKFFIKKTYHTRFRKDQL